MLDILKTFIRKCICSGGTRASCVAVVTYTFTKKRHLVASTTHIFNRPSSHEHLCDLEDLASIVHQSTATSTTAAKHAAKP